MQPILEVKNVTKLYRRKGGAFLYAADDVTLNVNAGEIVGFLGPNGAGKSTVIKIITGMALPTSGEVFIEGYSAQRERIKAMEYVGGVIESPDMYLDWSGYANLSYLATLQNKETFYDDTTKDLSVAEARKKRVLEVLDVVGLTDRKDDLVRKYSLGMKQRLGIAQSLLNRPHLLILDEPANGLDPAGIKEIRDLLKMLAHDVNMAVLVSSHQLSEMQLMCDRVYIIKNGKIVAEKYMTELDKREDGGSSIIQLSTDKPNEVRALLAKRFNIEAKSAGNTLEFLANVPTSEITKEIVMSGYNIFGIQIKEPSLEDVFMDVVGNDTEQKRHGPFQNNGQSDMTDGGNGNV